MSQVVCMDSMPENVPKSQQKLFRISSGSSIRISTLGLPELPPNIDATILIANKADPPLNYEDLGSFPFYIKIVQLLIAIICAGLYSEGLAIMKTSTAFQLLPSIVFSVYMIINTVSILSYVLGQKMPESLLRIFGMLGSVLFAAAGAVSLRVWGEYTETVNEKWNERNKNLMLRAPKMLLAEGFMALLDAALYVIDTGYSFHKARAVFVPAT